MDKDAGRQSDGPQQKPPPIPPPQLPWPPPQQLPPSPRHLTPAWLLLWLLAAAAGPVLVAMLGVFARYLQVNVPTPFPPLRFTSVLALLSLATLLLCHALPRCLLHLHRRRRLQCKQQCSRELCYMLDAAEAAETEARLPAEMGACQPGPLVPRDAGTKRSSSSSRSSRGKLGDAADNSGRGSSAGGGTDERSEALKAPLPALLPSDPAAPPPPGGHAPQGRSLPGLEQLHRSRPAAHRTAVLLVSSACCEAAILGQNIAPALVDPAVVMLVSMFTVVGVALLARLWLKAPLQWLAVVPAAAAMIGGAAMLLVPDIQAGGGQAGSLTSGRSWLGFGLSVAAMLGNVLFIVLAQAFKDSQLSAIEVQYTICTYNLFLVLPISLGVDGTDWAAQFSGMGAKEWGALLFCGCVAHAWIAVLIQASTKRLGGLTVSMFFGLRLVTSVAGSKAILGTTIVQSGVQVAGILLVCLALTAYTALHWRWATRQ